jgi:hypothetical protein
MSEGRAIRVFDYVNHPFERVRAALLADTKGILSRATSMASERGHTVASALRLNVAGIEIGKQIDIDVLGSYDDEPSSSGLARATRIELRWRALANPGLFPTMNGVLTLYPLSSTETQLDLKGNYEPPLGTVGVVLDALAGHRIAEACVHQFITDVAERLRRDLA